MRSNQTLARKKVTIRQARGTDAVEIAKLLEEWFTVAAIEYPEPEPYMMLQWVKQVMSNGYVVVAAIKDDTSGKEYLVGAAGITGAKLPWNDSQVVARDQFFYVQEAWRKAGTSPALMKALQLYCCKRSVPLFMQIVSGRNTDRLEKWYELQGGKYIGGVMAFGIPTVTEEDSDKDPAHQDAAA